MRAGLRVAGLILLLLTYAPLHVLTKTLTGRSAWPQRFLMHAAWMIGARVTVDGAPIAPHSLILANHVSWLDILALGGTTGCAFVSKDNLGHGLIHWLADQNHTVYVRREHVKGAKDQANSIARALERGPVALFPEGTVGPGTHLLPFRSTLLEAANYAAKDVVIRPVAIDYGSDAADIAWFHEPVKRNILRVLGRHDPVRIRVHLLDPLPRTGDRKSLAREARAAIAEALGFKLEDQASIAAAK